MVIVTFGYRDIKYMFKNMFYLYTSSIILGGFLYFLNLQFAYKNTGLVFFYNGLSVNFIVLIITSPIIIFAYIRQALELKNNYEVKLKALEHKEIEYCKLLQSLLDAKNEYEELIRQTKEIKTNLNYTYKKAFSDVKRDLVKH